MTQLNDEDFEIIHSEKTPDCALPRIEYEISQWHLPVQKLRELEINIALGTDGAASNNDLDND